MELKLEEKTWKCLSIWKNSLKHIQVKTKTSKFYLLLSKINYSYWLKIEGGDIIDENLIAKSEWVRNALQKTPAGLFIKKQEPFIDFRSNAETTNGNLVRNHCSNFGLN